MSQNEVDQTAVMSPIDVTGFHRGMKGSDRPSKPAPSETTEAAVQNYASSPKQYPSSNTVDTSSPYFGANPLPSMEQEPSRMMTYPSTSQPDIKVLLSAQARFISEQSFFLRLRTPSGDPGIYTQALQRYSEEQDRMISILTNALRQAGVL